MILNNIFKKPKPNSNGFAHHVVLPVIVIGLIALAGVRVIMSSHAASIVYYVSPNGNDSNNGISTSTPWKTINKVNSQKLVAGETVSFLGGSTYSGQLYLSPGESGTSTNPITINSYGGGVATINGGTGSALYSYNSAGLNINNLNFIGSGAATSTKPGLNFYNYGGGVLNYIKISNVTASGFQTGLSIGSGSTSGSYNNVSVDSSTFHDNEDDGIVTFGPSFNTSSPFYAVNNMDVLADTAYNNFGNPSDTGTTNSGNGIELGSTNNSTIEYSLAYANGATCKSNACGVGLWGWSSNNLTIKNNISYGNLTGSSADGDGYDLDEDTSNSTMEYNYSYNNQGAGYLVFGVTTNNANTGNTVRFNISQNDGQKNNYGGIMLYGNVLKASVYNNTVYMTKPSSGKPFPLEVYSGASSSSIRNNILYAAGGLEPVYIAFNANASSLSMQGNDYYPMGVYYGSTNYTSLATFQSKTGQELLNGKDTGSSANPGLSNAGAGPALTNPYNLKTLTQYQLASGSAMKNAGINLTTQFGTSMGGIDFYGVTIPTSSGISIGAAE